MRFVRIFCVLLLATGCSRGLYTPSPFVPPLVPSEVLRENVARATGVPVYASEMEPGERFLLVVFPGYPFSETELSFAAVPGEVLLGKPDEIDKAYRFYRLTNPVVNPGEVLLGKPDEIDKAYRFYRLTNPVVNREHPEAFPSQLWGSLYREIFYGIKPDTLTGEPFPDPPDPWYSATYDDAFYFTTVVPAGASEQTGWSRYEDSAEVQDSVRAGGAYRPVRRPVWKAGFEMKRYRIERPWFDFRIWNRYAPRKGCRAMIREIILLKGTVVDEYSRMAPVRFVLKKGEIRLKEPQPSSSVSDSSVVLAAFVCEIL